MKHYQKNNKKKTKALTNLVKNMKNDPISKLQSYSAIKIETQKLLEREKVLFMINCGVTGVLLITLFKLI